MKRPGTLPGMKRLLLALAITCLLPTSAAAQVAQVGPPAAYPNPATTSGLPDPNVTQDNIGQTICVKGYTETVRPPVSYTDQLKVQQIADYGYADTNTKDYEEDHFIPLEVGGNPTDQQNLWPMPYAQPFGARDKDRVENYLRDQVCSGAMTLADAQAAITSDWVAVYQTLPAAASGQAAIAAQPPAPQSPAAPAAPAAQAAAPGPSQAVAPPAAQAPPGATFRCVDGSYSFAKTSKGACSDHKGIGATL